MHLSDKHKIIYGLTTQSGIETPELSDSRTSDLTVYPRLPHLNALYTNWQIQNTYGHYLLNLSFFLFHMRK